MMLLENRNVKIAVRTLAIALAAMLVLLTVVPAADRLETGLPHDVEHFVAFLLLGILFALGFDVRTRTMLLMSVAFSTIIECMQIPLPTRHARIEDLIVDAVGMCAGILFARFAQACFQRAHSRQANPAE